MKFYFLLIFLFLSNFVLGQDLHYDQYTTDDGLPSNTIYEIIQDSTGLLWIGTENGLVSFDGVNFNHFSDPRLKDNDIIELELSKDGHVTFANISNQYCRLEGDSLSLFEIDSKSSVYLKSSALTDCIISDSFIHTIVSQNNIVSKRLPKSIGIDVDSSGKFEFISECETVENLDDYSPSDLCFDKISSSPYGTSIGKINDLYYVFRLREVFLVDSILSKQIELGKFTYLINFSGLIYVASKEGLVIYNKADFVSTTYLNSFEFNYAFIDKENILWLSTVNDGILKIVIRDFDVLYNSRNGEEIHESFILDNNLWALSFSNMVNYDRDDNLMEDFIFDQKYDKFQCLNDRYIFVFAQRIAYVYDTFIPERGFVSFSFPFGCKAVTTFKDSIYVSTLTSVFKVGVKSLLEDYSNSTWEEVGRISKMNVMVGSEQTGNLFIGTDLGLIHFDDSKVGQEKLKWIIKEKNIKCLGVNDLSELLIGTSNDGVYILNEAGELTSINVFDIIGTNVINDVEQNGDFLFIATPNGLIRYSREKEEFRCINERNGFFSNYIRSISIKSLDSIYITQGKRIIRISNSSFDNVLEKPQLVLKEILKNNIKVNTQNSFVNEYYENNFEFKFDFYAYRGVKNKMLEYRFSKESDWVTSSDMNLNFYSLNPGFFELEVRGVLSKFDKTSSKVYTFTILPPWWETTKARLLGLLGFGGLVYLILYRRNQRVLEQEEQKRETIKRIEASKRKYLIQINKVKDQALQLQMNPHFIFNAMNAIQNFITSDREKEASDYLTKFAKLIRLIFEYSTSNLIKLESEIEFVQLYLELEMLRFKNKVTCELILSDEIEDEKDILRIPPLIIQPIIENSFKHGLFHKMGDGKLKITYDLIGNTLVIMVEDNGVGRKASETFIDVINGKNDRYSALKNVEERLALLAYNYPLVDNGMTVVDLFCDGEPCGTRTLIKISIDANK